MFPVNDLTSQLHLLHKQFAGSSSSSSSNQNKKKEQIFEGALRTLDDSVREACNDAKSAIAAAVKATESHSCFHQMMRKNNSKKKNRTFINTRKAASQNPLSQDITLSIELTDGRLIAACSATQQLAAAVAKTASTLNVRTDDFVAQRNPDRIDFLLDHDDNELVGLVTTSTSGNNNKLSSLFSRNTTTKQQHQDKNAFAIKHVAVAVQCLSQMASEARVCLAIVRDEAERVRLQRLKFAKCGVIGNPMDNLATSTTTSASDVLSQGSKLLLLDDDQNQQLNNNRSNNENENENTSSSTQQEERLFGSRRANKFLKNLTSGTEELITKSGVGKASNEILSSVVKKAHDSGVTTSSVFSRVSLFSSTTTSAVGSVFDNVSKFADNIILGKDDEESDDERENNKSKSRNRVHQEENDQNIVTKSNPLTIEEEEELNKKRKKRAAELKQLVSTSTRVDQRKLGEYTKEMTAEGKSLLNWREMAAKQEQQQQSSDDTIMMNTTNLEDQLGLRQEHEGLQHKFKNESAQSAKEVERSIQELGRMTTILQEQVSLQTEQLLVIEKNTDESVSNIEKAQEELEKHDLDKFWTFKRILAAIIWAHTILLIVLHVVIR